VKTTISISVQDLSTSWVVMLFMASSHYASAGKAAGCRTLTRQYEMARD
jgi:hypothetical protein